MASICDWCRDLIEDSEDETRLKLVDEDGDVVLRGWPTFHRDCGIMALYAATEAIEDKATGERPDPTTDELLNHIPTLGDFWRRGPDGPVSDRMRLTQHLGERSAAQHTLLAPASARCSTRASVPVRT